MPHLKQFYGRDTGMFQLRKSALIFGLTPYINRAKRRAAAGREFNIIVMS